jgi:uncharacterized repeat protein (TIGR01451 family)
MKSLITSGLITAFLALNLAILVKPAEAQYTPSNYVSTRQFYVDKKVYNPNTSQYVDNLTRDQFVYNADQTVYFRIEIKNTGNENLYNFVVTDQLPAELDYLSGGSTNKGGLITFNIESLSPGDVKQFFIQAKVKALGKGGDTVSCPTNTVSVQTGNLTDQDSSSFCIGLVPVKAPLPVEELPKTGLPIVAWGLAGLLPIGLKLKKFGQNSKDNENNADYIWQKRQYQKES